MKNQKTSIIIVFAISIIFTFFGAWLTIWHVYPDGAQGAFGAGIFHSILGFFLLLKNKKQNVTN